MARQISKRQADATGPELDMDCTALYIRVSTDKQADEGFSLDAQRQRLDAYCIAQGWTVCEDHVYIDSDTGKNTDRPGFQGMLRAAQAGAVRRIVAIRLDRIARNTREFLATADKMNSLDVSLVLIKESFDTSTPHGKFALTMFAAMAELEIATIQERTMDGRRQKARQGGSNGAPAPLGYTYNGEAYAIDGQAAQGIVGIFNQFTDGESLTAIARTLNEQGQPTAKGGKWYASTVRYILSNGFYCGLVQYDGIETQGDHPAIIDRQCYETAITRLHSLRPGPMAN